MTENKPLMAGKRGLIMGVANDRSIAWAIAQAVHAQGAELAFTYQGDAFGKRVKPLAESVGSDIVLDCDVTNEASLDTAFAALKERWGRLDFLVHAIAFSDPSELKGKYVDTTRANIMKIVSNIDHWSFPIYLPGISLNTTPDNLFPMRVTYMKRYNGTRWDIIGKPISEAE